MKNKMINKLTIIKKFLIDFFTNTKFQKNEPKKTNCELLWKQNLNLSLIDPKNSLLKSRITVQKKGFFCEKKSYGIGLNLNHPKVKNYVKTSLFTKM